MDIHAITTQEVLDKISRHCPDALSTYLQCINLSNERGSAFFSRKMVDVDMSEDWRSFKNRIKKLAREGLLEWHPIDGGISITLADLNEDA